MRYTFISCLILILIASCSKEEYPTYNDPIPEHKTLTIASKAVGEDRVINVWTPPVYATSANSLPVLYMPDGGIKEDFPHIANTLAKLVEEKKVPPFILVGIENTQRRRDLTGPTQNEEDKTIAPEVGGSANFRAFILTELIPEIDSSYRTTPYKGIIGESLAGLFVVETLMTTPSAFDFYIAMDPSVWWNDEYYVKNAQSYLSKLPTDKAIRFWFAGSGAQKDNPIITALSKVIQENTPDNLTWTYSDEPEEEHHTIFRATKEKAITWSLNN